MIKQMERWPKNWAGDRADEAFGIKLMAEMKPFVAALIAHGYAKRTMERHLENLFLLGGEVIRDVSLFERYNENAGDVLRESVEGGEGLLCRHLHTEAEERAYDATCRKLCKFLEKR